jgi:DNA (cytosine-5)-methyltransferase 1
MIIVDNINDVYNEIHKSKDKDYVTSNDLRYLEDKLSLVEENLYYWNGEPIAIKRNGYEETKLNVVELFCGCGGTSLGFEMAGFNIALGIDIHIPSIQTFTHNHPKTSVILGDIKNISPNIVTDLLHRKRIDVLIAGVPCQGFSLNNKKRHIDDNRNYLYKEFIKFVEVLKPRSVMLENVSGMVSTGDIVNQITNEVGAASGLTINHHLLDAQDYGVPQKRKRLVFIGLENEMFQLDEVTPTHGDYCDKPFNTVRDAIGDLPSLFAGQSINTYDKAPSTEYQTLMRRNSHVLMNHEAPNHPQETIDKIKATRPGCPMYPKFRQRIRLAWESLSPTQVSGGIRPQFQFGHPEDARGLTIRERCRIQSFPDTFYVAGGIVQGRVQTGNAVPPLLAKAVAMALKEKL